MTLRQSIRARSSTATARRMLWLATIPALLLVGWNDVRSDFDELDKFEPAFEVPTLLPGFKPTVVKVEPGAARNMSGASWRLVSVRDDVAPVDADGVPQPVKLPAQTRLVVVTIAVDRAPDAADSSLGGCTVVLVDGQGRTWEPASVTTELSGDTFCDPTFRDEALDSYEFQQAFIVPADLAPGLRPAVWTEASLPAGLEFVR